MFSYDTLRARFLQLIDAVKKPLENTREFAKEELLALADFIYESLGE